MSRRIRLAFILVYLTGGSLAAADWPQWRGPSGTGTTAETGLPVKWSATENVAWKAPIGGLGVSTPIVVGDRVFVTSQLGAGIRQPGNHPRLVQGGNAAEANGGYFHFDLFANLCVWLNAPSIKYRKLIVPGNYLFGNNQLRESLDITVLLVNDHAQFTGRADCLLGRRKQRFLYSTNEDIPINALFAFPKLEYC